jgi:hypothetical protein
MLQRICFIYIIVSFLCVAFHSKYWQLPSGNQTVELARIRLFSVCDFFLFEKKTPEKIDTTVLVSPCRPPQLLVLDSFNLLDDTQPLLVARPGTTGTSD